MHFTLSICNCFIHLKPLFCASIANVGQLAGVRFCVWRGSRDGPRGAATNQIFASFLLFIYSIGQYSVLGFIQSFDPPPPSPSPPPPPHTHTMALNRQKQLFSLQLRCEKYSSVKTNLMYDFFLLLRWRLTVFCSDPRVDLCSDDSAAQCLYSKRKSLKGISGLFLFGKVRSLVCLWHAWVCICVSECVGLKLQLGFFSEPQAHGFIKG